MIEPTETESKEDIDLFIDALKAIAKEAQDHPELLHSAPQKTFRRRLDETSAAMPWRIALHGGRRVLRCVFGI